MGVWGFGVFGPLPPKNPKAPNTQIPFFGSMLGELSIDNLRSSLGIFSATFYLPCPITRYACSYAAFRGSSGIFPATFHLPWPTSEVHRKSFLHLSIYPSRFQGFIGNLFINFPYTFPDNAVRVQLRCFLRSPKKFSAFFHLPWPTLEVRRKSFHKLSIYLYR